MERNTPVRGNYFTAESDKIYAVEHSLKIHLGIRHNTNFRCEIDLDKGIAMVYYPTLKVTWKEEKELERGISLNKTLSENALCIYQWVE